MGKLVIVESPAKAKTISKYLGDGYSVKATMGHIRDLPSKKLSVDINNGFEPTYEPIPGKASVIDELRQAAKKSDYVYLATDPDREGEAISWHLSQLLDLDPKLENRVTFNEITRNAVTEGIRSPRAIDENLVDAQQARRVLDRLVGYKLSPFLWKKVRKGLSAGRVQSVVTRLVVDRERAIKAFKPEEYWSLDVQLTHKSSKKPFTAHYYGDETGKVALQNQAQTDAVKDEVTNAAFTVSTVKLGERRRQPQPPFTTSTLQQDAARRLGMASKRTMAVAQQLYEGINLSGQGLTGLITYMRTDSVRISNEALDSVRTLIRDRYGAAYCPKSPRMFKSKGGAQDAHEAIRPSHVELSPDMLKGDLNRDQLRLYKLIWERFVACQMAQAVYDVANVEISAGRHLFKATGSHLKFAGYTTLYEESRGDDAQDESSVTLPKMEVGDPLSLVELQPEQHFTQPPARYNEASLIKTMEEKGIGRPSTYAPTISTILDRDYVEKEGKALKPTPLGEAVTDLMLDQFSDIVDVRFTAGMESQLDRVDSGEMPWRDVLAGFYSGFSAELKKAEEAYKEKRVKIEAEETDEVCELCGRKMVIKYGRFGRFLACPGYPECKNAKPLLDDTGAACPLCGARVVRKRSKKGKVFYTCEHSPKQCSFITWDAPTNETCPQCGKVLFRHTFKNERYVSCLDEKCGYKKEFAAKKSGKKAENTEEVPEQTGEQVEEQA